MRKFRRKRENNPAGENTNNNSNIKSGKGAKGARSGPSGRKDSRSLLYAIVLVSLCIAVTSVTALVLIIKKNQLRQMEQERESLEALDNFDSGADGGKENYTKAEVAELIQTAEDEYTQIGRDEILDSIRGTVEATGSTLEALRGVFGDYAVLSNGNGHAFYPLDKSIEPNQYPPELFVKNPDGTMTYVDEESGTTAIAGIDVSSHQGEINWEAVASSGIEYAFIRAGYRGYSEGAILDDEQFEANIKGALDNKIHTGVYFFTQAINEAEVKEEVDYLIDRIKDYDFDGPVVIDVEEVDKGGRTAGLSAEERTKLIQLFCSRVSEKGYEPMIYGNLRSVFLMFDYSELKDIPLWYAYYSYPIYFPYKYSILQYSSSGKLPGINTSVDLNLCFEPWW